jgi:hypothetical protein
MKKAEDFIKNFGTWDCETNYLRVIAVDDCIEAIKLAQEDAIIDTVKECTEHAECTSIDMEGFYKVDKQSILQVADKLIEQLNINQK